MLWLASLLLTVLLHQQRTRAQDGARLLPMGRTIPIPRFCCVDDLDSDGQHVWVQAAAFPTPAVSSSIPFPWPCSPFTDGKAKGCGQGQAGLEVDGQHRSGASHRQTSLGRR